MTYLCKYFYLHITLSFIADETNELCTGGEILPEEGDDKTDDGRYYYFGVYIKLYMCDICNGFLVEYVQY